jgi:hypothetical protein
MPVLLKSSGPSPRKYKPTLVQYELLTKRKLRHIRCALRFEISQWRLSLRLDYVVARAPVRANKDCRIRIHSEICACCGRCTEA